MTGEMHGSIYEMVATELVRDDLLESFATPDILEGFQGHQVEFDTRFFISKRW